MLPVSDRMFISILPGDDEHPVCTDNTLARPKITCARGHMAAFSGIELGAPEANLSSQTDGSVAALAVCACSDHMSHKMEESRRADPHTCTFPASCRTKMAAG